MQEKYKKLILMCAIISLLLSGILITFLSLSESIHESDYKTEKEIINEAYLMNGFGEPTFNNNTRQFEWISAENTYYIGFTTFNDWNTNELIIYEFKNGSIVNLGSERFVYTSENNDWQIIYSKEILRRFK